MIFYLKIFTQLINHLQVFSLFILFGLLFFQNVIVNTISFRMNHQNLWVSGSFWNKIFEIGTFGTCQIEWIKVMVIIKGNRWNDWSKLVDEIN